VATAEIKILSTHAVVEVLNDLVPAFERTTGHRFAFTYNPSAAIMREIDGGAAFDVAIVTRPAIDRLAAQGKIVRETCADIGRCGLGVAVRKGARKPNIATVDAFKRALLAAKTVARSRDGTSGQYFETLLGRLGIAEAMRGKIIIGPAGRIAELVARGEAELAVQQVPELVPVKGADFVGPFPGELQVYTVFAAGVAAASQHRDAAQAFIAALAAPSAAPLFKAKGLEPVLH
jgi:molybdate transport system substrate-binding protein